MKPFLAFLSILIFYSCGSKVATITESAPVDSTRSLQLTDLQLKSFAITETQLQEKTITQTLKLTGMVDVPPQNLVSVSAALGGYLKSTKLLPGLHFNKGEVLAVMEDNQYIQLQQDYLTAKAQLENAQSEYLRQKDLNATKASSDKVYQQSKADYETLQATVRALEEKLRLINLNPNAVSVENIRRTVNIYAPFDGYVTRVMVNTGKYISPSDVMFELVNPNDLHLHLKVFEKDLSKIKIGQSLEAYTNNNVNKKYAGEIISIGKNLSDDRAVEVHAHFEKYDETLIPGLYMNADIQVPDNKSMAIPDESIVSFEGGHFVFKSSGKNKFEMVAVQTGSSGSGWTEIVNPEKLMNEKIIQKGAYTLLMALKNKGEE